jgi:purine nucleosidase/pyrimidine-specific ribonucleoside hydrolase
MPVPVPVLIDTDLGDDIDDALALAFALRSPELEVVGVTTVFQRAGLRARLARRICAACGRPDVPVVAGLDRPLLGSVHPDWRPSQAALLDGEPDEPRAEAQRAVDFIIAQGLRREGLVVVPIGPMTNVAVALAAEPALARRVRVVAMAGAWDRETAEWNVVCDPEAAGAVLASGVPVDFVGLDVTEACPMRPGDLAALAASTDEPGATLWAFVRAWQRAGGRDERFAPLLHDALAIAAVFRRDLVAWEEGAVAVDLGEARRGVTSIAAGGGPEGGPCRRVARHVDTDRFTALWAARVCGTGGGA